MTRETYREGGGPMRVSREQAAGYGRWRKRSPDLVSPDMTTYTDTNPLHVVIAGGGVAALETMMALRHLAADRVQITLLAPERDYHYRPMAVAEPFSIAHARQIALVAIAADFDARHVCGALVAVEPDERRVVTSAGERIGYDALVIACGTRTRPAFDRVITVDDRSIGVTLRGLVQDVEEGYSHKIAFVAPTEAFWPLPLYELALQTANRARDMSATVDIRIVSPEAAPLALLGSEISDDAARLLREAQITFHGASFSELAGDTLTLRPSGTELRDYRVVAMPLLEGPRISGVPSDPHGFIAVTGYGEVRGLDGVYAAGDITASSIKHGGIAAQQADLVAATIARRAGADVEHRPLRPTIRGALMTGRETRFYEAELGDDGAHGSNATDVCPWDSSAKIAAKHLGPYLAHGDRYAVRA
jgi:sulfide:quinone oxidoreductase